MIAITDNHTKRLVLEDLLLRMETGEVNTLLEAGVSPELLDALRNRTIRDLIGVSQMTDASVYMHVDASSFLSCFQRLDAMKRSKQLQEYFVMQGATPDLLQSLFKLALSQIRTLRATLRPGTPISGRPAMPHTKERDEIHRAWVEIGTQEKDIREQYYALHQRFSHHSMACLWATINEFTRLACKPATRAVTRTAHIPETGSNSGQRS